jgi:hypothetical protein
MYLKQHVCKGFIASQHLMQFALSYAHERVDQHHIDVVMASDSESTLKKLEDALQSYPHISTFEPGWTITPKHGHIYGQRYIEPFKVEITDMFIAGRSNKSKRMGAG